MGRKRKAKGRWQKAYARHRRDFLQFVLVTYGAVLAWGLGRYFPAPAAPLPPISGAADVVLAPVTAGPYSIAPMVLTWTGSEMDVREGGAPAVSSLPGWDCATRV
jgi:hypothetical protein